MLFELTECNFDFSIMVNVAVTYISLYGFWYMLLAFFIPFNDTPVSPMQNKWYVDNIDNIVLVECLFIELFEHI